MNINKLSGLLTRCICVPVQAEAAYEFTLFDVPEARATYPYDIDDDNIAGYHHRVYMRDHRLHGDGQGLSWASWKSGMLS